MELDQFNKLTKDVALDTAKQQSFYREIVGNHRVEEFFLKVNENWNANLNLVIPTLMAKKEQKKSKKGKTDRLSLQTSNARLK